MPYKIKLLMQLMNTVRNLKPNFVTKISKFSRFWPQRLNAADVANLWRENVYINWW